MNGREFLDVARKLAVGRTEAEWRSAAGRAYYALFLEARARLENWGFRRPARDQVHAFVRLKFIYANDLELKRIGRDLEKLGAIRNEADYQLISPVHEFSTGRTARDAVELAERSILLLDQIEADPARLVSAIQSLRPPNSSTPG
jgi:uncharacterized protein (UPF0332 family)